MADYQDVPEELSALICEYIKCPRCHYGRDGDTRKNPSAGIFTLGDEVYTRRELNEFWGFEDKLFCEFAARYGITIENSGLYELRQLLSTNPMMAMRNETAQKIYHTLQANKDSGHADRLTSEEGKLYRGRNRKRDSNKRFKRKDLYSPPLGSASHGRYNAIGVPVLYVANKLAAIPHEIHPAHDGVMDVGEILKHFQQHISRESVAEHVSLSPGYLSIAFKKYIGLGIVAYMVKMRLDHAKYLLKSSKLPIREVSDACGFTDSFYFTRVFKKETGMNPRDYRNS